MPKTDLLQGTLDLLILKILALGPNHGWGISNRIRQILPGGSLCQPRLALPGASPAGNARPHQVGNGAVGEQPAGARLHADGSRKAAVGSRDAELGAVCAVNAAGVAHDLDRHRR